MGPTGGAEVVTSAPASIHTGVATEQSALAVVGCGRVGYGVTMEIGASRESVSTANSIFRFTQAASR